jgi:hypothetical protein
MGMESIVYGMIAGFSESQRGYPGLVQHNREVIASLPEMDSWPCLTRSMFKHSPPSGAPGVYESAVIHFGASFDQIEWDWHQWLAKFEALLARLYWFTAEVTLITGTVGNHTYRWSSEIDFTQSLPRLSWRFEGGPRDFDFSAGFHGEMPPNMQRAHEDFLLRQERAQQRPSHE